MPRFSLLQIAEARDVSIHSMLGIATNRRVAICCPFHREKTPSFVIYPDNSYHCYGCGVHGNNAIDFVMQMGLSFNEAVQELLATN